MEDLTMHVGQSPVDSVVSEGEAVMVDTEQMGHCSCEKKGGTGQATRKI